MDWKFKSTVQVSTFFNTSSMLGFKLQPLPREKWLHLQTYEARRQLSRYSDSLRVGRSGDRIPVGGEIFRTRGSPSLLYNGYWVSFLGVKRLWRGVDHAHSTIAEVKETVEL